MIRFRRPILRAGCALLSLLPAVFCIPGGVVREGGLVDHLLLIPTATRTRGAEYRVVCPDQKEVERRNALQKRRELEIRTARKAGEKPPPPLDFSSLNPPFKLVEPVGYDGTCDRTGQHSAFYLFNLVRMTSRLDPERAITTAVQEVEGDTMIGIRAWHETHYYSILGSVRVFKVKGTVVKFRSPADAELEQNQGAAP